MIIIFDDASEELVVEPVKVTGMELALPENWKRSICRNIDYPNFKDEVEVQLPDHLAEEMPEFSGLVRYENMFMSNGNESLVLEVTNAAEGVEVFVNGHSAGIQIVPPYQYDISALVKEGDNKLVIEVATNLERETYYLHGINSRMDASKISSLSGITGQVKLYKSDMSVI